MTTQSAHNRAADLVRDAHRRGVLCDPLLIARETGLTLEAVDRIIDRVAAEGPARKRGAKPDPKPETIDDRATAIEEAKALIREANHDGRIPDADRIAQTVGLPVAVAQHLCNESPDIPPGSAFDRVAVQMVADVVAPEPVVEWEAGDQVHEVSLLGYAEQLGKLTNHPSERISLAAAGAAVALGQLMQELDRVTGLEARRERLRAELAEVEAELRGAE